MNEHRDRLRRLTVDDPLLRKQAEVTTEGGLITVQVGEALQVTENHDLHYGEHRFANPLKTSVDIVNEEGLCPALPISAELLAAHRKALRTLCQPTASENKAGPTTPGKS